MGRSVEPLLGTRGEVEVWVDSPDEASALEDAVIAEAERLEAIFTVFDPDSELHAFRASGTTEVPELLEVLTLAEHWRSRSGGAFEPQIQSLMTLWDRAEEAGSRPAPAELAAAVAALAATPVDNLNAIAKGWIAERALDRVTGSVHGIEHAWLNLGGDIVHRGTEPLTVGIEDPARPYDNVAPLATIDVCDEALATSGGARRYWTIDGVRHAKVLDPRTGMPVDRIASATVIAPSAADADVLATIGLIMDEPDFFALLDAADTCALLVRRDGTIATSSDRFVVRPSPAT